ncbi:hypothetical protein EDB87DRAFT_1684683 [Lactarius vividus]|nr:hypothetical protein EDB87DRAFT_1684683 [Lactarius vividus]
MPPVAPPSLLLTSLPVRCRPCGVLPVIIALSPAPSSITLTSLPMKEKDPPIAPAQNLQVSADQPLGIVATY